MPASAPCLPKGCLFRPGEVRGTHSCRCRRLDQVGPHRSPRPRRPGSRWIASRQPLSNVTKKRSMLRIELPGKETQKVFDAALTSLAKDAPPVPGFRRSKGDTKQHSPVDARQEPGHQVHPSRNTQRHRRRFRQEGEPQGEP
uniref:Trigger factor ribosome-binding bacterial domain-containing protein n=1 Tax=Aegilops tauschii subsp. strangulata TaxID=200361 RepID=A0A453G5R9_AEGTS